MGNRGLALPCRRQPPQFSDGFPVPDRSARALARRSPAGSRLRERHELIALHSSDPVDLRVRRRRLCKLPHRLCRARERNLRGRHEERTLNAFGLQYRAEIASQLYLSATFRHDDNDQFQDADTWSVSGAWAIPGTGTRLHTSAGTGVTNPTFIEQFGFDPSTFIGNAALVPEEALGWDAGIEQTLFEDTLTVDVTYFSSDLENEIYTAFLPGFLTTALNSTSDSDRSGWEFTVYADPTDDISLYGSLTQLDASEPAGIEIRRPEQTASLDASWDIFGGPVQLNLGVSYTGESTDTDFGTFLRTPVDAYTLVRLGASWQVSDKLELYTRVENLLDEDYEEVIGYLGAPQGLYFGLRFRDEASK